MISTIFCYLLRLSVHISLHRLTKTFVIALPEKYAISKTDHYNCTCGPCSIVKLDFYLELGNISIF